MYHVGLDLTADQVQNLKRAALDDIKTVKELVTDLVVTHLGNRSGKPAAGGGSRGGTSAKVQHRITGAVAKAKAK